MIIDLCFTHVGRFVSDRTKCNPHLIDEHDGENGLVDVLGFAVGEKEREGGRERQGRHLAQHVAEIGTQCDNSEVGQSSAKLNLREACDSLQDDIELSSLAGTNGNTCGLKQKTEVSVNLSAAQKLCLPFSSLLFSFLQNDLISTLHLEKNKNNFL